MFCQFEGPLNPIALFSHVPHRLMLRDTEVENSSQTETGVIIM